MKVYDIAIIGAGPAGLAAAIAAKEEGIRNLIIFERDRELGGILNQCIHNGFGLHTFSEELTGPEYADRFIKRVRQLNIKYKLNTMVIDLNSRKEITYVNAEEGLQVVRAKAVILAMGCRERPRGALNIPGFRGAGIYSAGTAQRLINIEGYMPGRSVVILGSGDIGLIMARRMTLEGAKVKAVVELMPYSGGLKRNIVQCLTDYDIPLLLNHTVVDIAGRERVEGVTIAEVDGERQVISGTETDITCDTLLLSVGLLPENELTLSAGIELDKATGGPIVTQDLCTSADGFFACGNVLHVHDLVDYVSEEAGNAGINAAKYVMDKSEGRDQQIVELKAGAGIRYTVPHKIVARDIPKKLMIHFRVADQFYNKYISIYYNEERVFHRKKRVMAPGEMEKLILPEFDSSKDIHDITICVEEV